MTAARVPALAVLFVIVAQPSPAAETAPELWEAWYSVSAQVRTKRVDADLMASGRLAMTGRTAPSGELILSLDEVLEAPWKLYWVDPLGPIGEEVKVASVVTLREASWDALAAAQAESEASASERHRRWFETAKHPRPLDGSFAFVVVGDPRDGFRLDIAPNGRLANATNRLTDRWIPGPFDQFVDRAATKPAGYWFWNQGETVPHGFEPHTYHGFAAALELLLLDLPAIGDSEASGSRPVVWHRVRQRALGVLSILAPKLNAGALQEEQPDETRMTVTREALPMGGSRLTLTVIPTLTLPHVERETVFSSAHRPVSDRIRVRVATKGGGGLEVEAGYRPWHAKKESK